MRCLANDPRRSCAASGANTLLLRTLQLFFCFDFDQPLSLFPELFGFDVCAEIRPFLLPVVRANYCPNFLHSSTAIRSAALCAVGPTARRLNLFSFSFLALYAHFFVLVWL